jgi:hypothetical protein
MATNYTIFATYILEPTGTTIGHGYSKAIHCNYIKSIEIESDNIGVEEVRINFSGATNFKFLSSAVSNGTGYTAHKIYALIQSAVTSTTGFTVPNAAKWKKVDITNQVTGYTTGGTFMLTPANLTSVVFRIPLNIYASYITYDLTYLKYPSSLPIDDDKLCFGDETYFLGNVTSEIHADVYTTDISINLSLNEFNSTSNLTWDGISSVAITEIGIYDSNKNLVAIGKLNNPITKDSSISRTIAFAIDF